MTVANGSRTSSMEWIVGHDSQLWALQWRFPSHTASYVRTPKNAVKNDVKNVVKNMSNVIFYSPGHSIRKLRSANPKP